MRILYAEDEKQMSAAVTAVLRHNNYSVDAVYDGEDAVDWALSVDYDILILDIMMPKKDGIEILKELRDKGVTAPALLLTAKSQVSDRVSGLDAGADDYLSKPFSMEELLARLRALSRRTKNYTQNILSFGNTTLDRTAFRISGPDGVLALGSKEFQIMEMLMSANGATVPPERIMDSVWGLETESDISIVWVYISYLRKRLSAMNSKVKIVSKRNIGYKLELQS